MKTPSWPSLQQASGILSGLLPTLISDAVKQAHLSTYIVIGYLVVDKCLIVCYTIGC